MNLRLKPDDERALRNEAERSGRTQHEVIRAALARYLQIDDGVVAPDVADLHSMGLVRPARTAVRMAAKRMTLPAGVGSLELLDRDDRL